LAFGIVARGVLGKAALYANRPAKEFAAAADLSDQWSAPGALPRPSTRTESRVSTSDGKPRQPAEPLYLMVRAGRAEDFNRLRKAGQACAFHGCDFRGIDLRGLEVAGIDFSDCYFRQADLRGLDLRTCRLEGASLHAAHVSGVYFPAELTPAEIDLSVRLGTRMRYR
jgi:Pentapeptide repeats (9 copies)